MKLSSLVGERFKERPADCVIDSHALCVRGGYIKYVANGIYSLYTPMRRITQKIEKIIREEMDRIDGQEVLFPVVMPKGLWEESGRYDSVGSELLRFTDRNKSDMILGMTHEEAAVSLVKDYGNTYARYPFMIYQIQTKFRDEARPRAGLIRVREFTMKDAYSFHTSQEDLERYYDRCFAAYKRIFQKAGLPQVLAVKSDSGMMGGNLSHEYMLLTEAGEDSVVICPECGYSSNMEAAQNQAVNKKGQVKELERKYTPDCKTIEDVCKYLGEAIENSCKAVIYQTEEEDEYAAVFLRGDYEVNETKLVNYLGKRVRPALISKESGLVAGFCGPYKLNAKCRMLYDKTLQGIECLCAGANEADYHYTGLNIARDIGKVEYIDLAKIQEGAICPSCGKASVTIKKGIEVGNIFQLGTKYSKAMGMTYSDEEGNMKNPLMGCYGIGIGRLAASICEAYHDDYGPIWPISIAPWEVHLSCMRVDKEECKMTADSIYHKLQEAGFEIIYDDRNIRAGAMFADADLLGVPIRILVGPKNLKENKVEIMTRDKRMNYLVDVENIISEVRTIRERLYEEINCRAEEEK